MWSTDWRLNHPKELDRLTRKVINDCSGKHKHESTSLLVLQLEQGRKGLVELKTLYMQEHQVNNSQLYQQLKQTSISKSLSHPSWKKNKVN